MMSVLGMKKSSIRLVRYSLLLLSKYILFYFATRFDVAKPILSQNQKKKRMPHGKEGA